MAKNDSNSPILVALAEAIVKVKRLCCTQRVLDDIQNCFIYKRHVFVSRSEQCDKIGRFISIWVACL